MNYAQIKAVLFDAAGTLFHLREPVGVGYSRVAKRHGFALDPLATERVFREAWKSMPPMGSPIGSDGDRSERGWWRAVVDEVVTKLAPDACGDEDAFFCDLFDEYGKPELWEVYPEAAGVLEELGRRSLRLAILSNFDARLLPVLDGLDLRRHFESVFYSGEIGHAKPSPEIFAHAVEALGLQPAVCLHVGDDPAADWDGARGAGLRVFQLDRKTVDLGSLL